MAAENFSGSMKETECPVCARRLDAAMSFDSDCAPGPGDFTVCIYCGAMCQFNESMELVAANRQELKQLREEHMDQFVHLVLISVAARHMAKRRKAQERAAKN